MNRREERNMEKLIAVFGGLLLLVFGLATYWTYNYTFLTDLYSASAEDKEMVVCLFDFQE